MQLAHVKSSEAESTRVLSLLVLQTDAVTGRGWVYVHKDYLVGALPVEINIDRILSYSGAERRCPKKLHLAVFICYAENDRLSFGRDCSISVHVSHNRARVPVAVVAVPAELLNFVGLVLSGCDTCAHMERLKWCGLFTVASEREGNMPQTTLTRVTNFQVLTCN